VPKWVRRSASGVLNAAGGVELSVSPSGEDWIIRTTRVTCVQPLPTSPEPAVVLYRNGVSPSNELEDTGSGFKDTSGIRRLFVSGETCQAVWTGGPAGALATLIVEGIAYPSGQGIDAYGSA